MASTSNVAVVVAVVLPFFLLCGGVVGADRGRTARTILRGGGVMSSYQPSFDRRTTLSRTAARDVYDAFARKSTMTKTTGGNDAASGYGGPAVTALLEMADFDTAQRVLDYGCGQGKLAELVLSSQQQQQQQQQDQPNESSSTTTTTKPPLTWLGVDQSPVTAQRFEERCIVPFGKNVCSIQLLKDKEPSNVVVEPKSIDRFVSTYCLDLLSEEDVYKVLDLAEHCLDPQTGKLLLAGITWGYTRSLRTFGMTLLWELLYIFWRRKVGGCRPQNLQPYLQARGWTIEKVVYTMPSGYPWMASEVLCATPPGRAAKQE